MTGYGEAWDDRPEYEDSTDPAIMRLVSPFHAPVRTPPARQLSLMPTLEDQVEEELPRLLRYAYETARIRAIMRRFEVSKAEAARAYRVAFKRYAEQQAYEHYKRNQAWYEWVGTEDHRRYVQAYMAELDRREKERSVEFDRKLAAGEEHVVKIAPIEDEEMVRLLNNPDAARLDFHGPWQAFIDRLKLTEYDARVLVARKAVAVVMGDPETLIAKHKFYRPDDRAEREPNQEELIKCDVCGAVLDYNAVGLCNKLGQSPYRCAACMGLDEKEAQSIIRYYRSSGCTMFI